MAQKKKQLIAEGKLDKHGRPNENTPKEYLRALPADAAAAAPSAAAKAEAPAPAAAEAEAPAAEGEGKKKKEKKEKVGWEAVVAVRDVAVWNLELRDAEARSHARLLAGGGGGRVCMSRNGMCWCALRRAGP
jgi:hypothetical protein